MKPSLIDVRLQKKTHITIVESYNKPAILWLQVEMFMAPSRHVHATTSRYMRLRGS